MNEEDVRTIIQRVSTENQYQVVPIPAHTHNGTDSMPVQFSSLRGITRYVLYRLVNATTDTSVANVVGGDFNMPIKGTVVGVGATVDTAGTTNTTTIDINKNGTTILKTKITIDSTEKTSRTAATPAVIDQTVNFFEIGDIFTFDVDAVSTTPAKGLTVFMDVIQILP